MDQYQQVNHSPRGNVRLLAQIQDDLDETRIDLGVFQNLEQVTHFLVFLVVSEEQPLQEVYNVVAPSIERTAELRSLDFPDFVDFVDFLVIEQFHDGLEVLRIFEVAHNRQRRLLIVLQDLGQHRHCHQLLHRLAAFFVHLKYYL